MSLRNELLRKAFHQMSIVIPIFYVLFGKKYTLYLLVSSTIIFILHDLIRYYNKTYNGFFNNYFGDLLRQNEKKESIASTYLLISFTVITFLFKKNIVITSMLFLIISDAAAAIAGKKFGRIKIFNKTLEGSLSFLITALIIAVPVMKLPLYQGIIGAFTAAVIELLPVKVSDNLTVPIVSAVVMTLVS